MKVLFLGSSHFSVVVLNEMLKNGVDVCGVITQMDKPAGRGHKLTPTEIKKFAIEKGIDVFTFDKLRNHIDDIKKIEYDIAVVASYGQILTDEFLSNKLTINVHPSLLPKYRGATPMQSAVLNGDKESGVTIMRVAKEVDSGDIILQKKVSIENKYFKEIETELGLLGGDLIFEVLKQIENNTVKFTPQCHKDAILVKKLSKNDGIINLNNSAEQIYNQVRALSEEIGCYLQLENYNLKIGKIIDVSNEFSVEKGFVLNNKKRFIIGCEGGAIEILSCQAPSGKMISGRDYLNGHNEILGVKIN